MIRKLLVIMLFVQLSLNLLAQPPLDWVYSSNIGGGFQDYIEDVYVDDAGNTYACGTFRGSLTIGSDNLFGGSAGQAFVAKFNSSGTPQWAIQSDGNSKAFAKSIVTDLDGNVYVAGYHSHSTLSFAGLSVISSSNEGFYILKISPNGLPLHLNGPTALSTGKSQAWAVVTDGDSVYVAGSHKANLSLPGGPTLPVTNGESDVFLVSIDSALNSFGYAVSHGGPETDKSYGMVQSGTDLYLTGVYGENGCVFSTSGPDYNLPAYGQEAIWLGKFDMQSGAVLWATSAGSASGSSRANDVTISGPSILITGAASDVTTFVDSPLPTGPFTYNDTLYSAGSTDIFVARYNSNGDLQLVWSEGGVLADEAFGISWDPSCSEVQICGGFRDSINFGNSTPLIANGQDIFVASYGLSGTFNWAFKEFSSGDEFACAISSGMTRTSYGGEFTSDIYLGTVPLTELQWQGFNDHFVSSFQCGTVAPCGPTITNCLENDTVVSDATCSHVLGNYTSGITVVDGCSTGITVTQSPPPLSILNAGIHEITLTAEDGGGNTDVCIFNLVVESNISPIIVECGDSFTGQTTGGQGNTSSSYSCSSISTPGEDAVYQVSVPAGNHFLQVNMDNVVDANDEYAYVYWLANNCPNTMTCVAVDSFDVAAGEFSNQSQYLTYIANGPGTYYFVVDAVTDSIESYDIAFSCNNSGVEFDKSGCTVQDVNSDGIVPFKNGSAFVLSMQPCESVTICHDLYLANLYDWEWVDSIEFKLGECYENINTATLSPDNPPADNGFYDANGEWSANYNSITNTILWEFDHSSGNPWGDGDDGQYNCNLYNLCFEADITAGCLNDEGLNIGIVVGDDGGKGGDVESNVFDIGNSNSFTLQDDNPFFSYSSPVFCEGDPNVVPDSITTPGGTFTADPGIVFTDGSPSSTGEIDLTASTVGGPYTITYEVGLCPFTKDTTVTIQSQQDPSFSYSQAAYCQGDTDPVPTISGTSGGTFTAPAEITFIDQNTGEIDLSASTAGGPYWIVYTTPGPYCVNVDSVQLTVDPEDVPTFNYPSIDYCAADPNVNPAFIATPGGTFSESSGEVSINSSTGEINIVLSDTGNFYIVYTTSGVCPNTDSVVLNIHPEDDPAFGYPAAEYCQGDSNPLPVITGTTGGSFSAPADIVFVSTSTGEIDLSASTAGGPYTITYTTPGPLCVNSATFDITIHAEDDPSFSYASNDFCQGDTVQIPTISGTTAGTFTADAGLDLLDANTGAIDPANSIVGGPYTVTYTTPGPICPNSSDFLITIHAEEDPSFSYSSVAYCNSETNPVPSVTTPGGSFISSAGVIFIDNLTGEIDLDASTAGGPYDVIYTTPGAFCPNSDTVQLTIIQQDVAAFTYGDTAFCSSEISIAPTITGTPSGIFVSSSQTLILDTLSGEIDLQNSEPVLHAVTYITSGTCPDTSTQSLNIYTQPTADAGPDQELFFLYETQLSALDPAVGTGNWQILSGEGFIQDLSQYNSMISDLENGVTVCEWRVTNGSCPDAVDEVEIVVEDLFIPQAITPNNDGDNDVLFIAGIEALDHQIEIFNRWGQKVYESTDYQNDWAGIDMNGNELSADTYFYIITAKETTFKGYLVIRK